MLRPIWLQKVCLVLVAFRFLHAVFSCVLYLYVRPSVTHGSASFLIVWVLWLWFFWLLCSFPPLLLVFILPDLYTFQDISDHFPFCNHIRIFWHECQVFLITGFNYLLYSFKGLICVTNTFFFGVSVIKLLEMVKLPLYNLTFQISYRSSSVYVVQVEKIYCIFNVFSFLLIWEHLCIFGEILLCLWVESLHWVLEYCLTFIGLRSGSSPR